MTKLPFKLEIGKWKKTLTSLNLSSLYWGKSAAVFCHKVATWVPDMFCNFYLSKNHINVNNSAIVKAREKISTYLKSSL
jgi:hypothetical protein